MQNDVLATGVMSFLLHEIFYFGRSIPFMMMDAIPFFNRYKLQNVRSHEIDLYIYTMIYTMN